MELTKPQREHLIRFYYSGDLQPTREGYVFRDGNVRADMRTVKALMRLGLVGTPGDDYFPARGGMVATRIHITPEGESLAETFLNV